MRRTVTTQEKQVEQAVHTAVSELQGAPLGDIVDAVCIQLPYPVFKEHEDAIWQRVSDLA